MDDKRDKMRTILWGLVWEDGASTKRFDELGIPVVGFREKYEELKKNHATTRRICRGGNMAMGKDAKKIVHYRPPKD